MTYQQTCDWLFAQLPMYQRDGASAYRKDLDNILKLSHYLAHPHLNFKSIHIAGTNGKGSTSSMLSSILQTAGYRVGLYTSPHLNDFRERIKINGTMISEQKVIDFVAKHQSFFEAESMSFFEMTVGLAFDYFSEEKVDVAIVEVGMGGRLDATNIITPLVSVITNIGLDHTQFLGNSLTAIAQEKAGIIKSNVPVVIGEYTSETQKVFLEKATTCNAKIYFASDSPFELFPSDLKGVYQEKNQNTVLQVCQLLQNDFTITKENIAKGLQTVQLQTGLQGRWQQIATAPLIIADTAHNAHGLKVVVPQLLQQKYNQLHIVLGVVNDKDLDEMLSFFPNNAIYYFAKPNIPRGLDAAILQQIAKEKSLIGNVYDSVRMAYDCAKYAATESDCIYIGGSTFVVAEVV